MSRFISLGSCGWKTNKQTRTRIRNGIVGASSSANVGRLLLGVGVERCSPRWLPWLARGLTEGPYPARGTTKFFSLHTSIDYFHAHYRQHTYICISLAFVFVPYPAPIFLARTRGGTSPPPPPRAWTRRDTRAARLSRNLTTFKHLLYSPCLFSLGRTNRTVDDFFPRPFRSIS